MKKSIFLELFGTMKNPDRKWFQFWKSKRVNPNSWKMVDIEIHKVNKETGRPDIVVHHQNWRETRPEKPERKKFNSGQEFREAMVFYSREQDLYINYLEKVGNGE